MTPSEPARYTPTPAGKPRPQPTPLGRREHIRDSLEHGDWRQAAQHLHEAHTRHEWHGCGLRSWSAYVETIPLSRGYDWKLRAIHRAGTGAMGISFRAAMRAASPETRTSPQPEG